MKRPILLALILLSFYGVSAQNITVKSFRALPYDGSASSLNGKRIDQNGEVVALIKVVTTETGFSFEGGRLGIVDTQQRNGEIWVWVPRASRRITILHQKFGVLRDYEFPLPIEAERTYEMVLATGWTETVVHEMVTEQFLVFNITPKDAMVTVNGTPWPVVDGVSQKMVEFGDYEYRIEASDYHLEAGRVKVDNPDNKVVLTIALKPAYGFLKIEGNRDILASAMIYVDNANGSEALKGPMKLASGNHKVRVVHPKYKPYERTVTITDNENTVLKVDLDANYSTVTLKVDDDAEIWVNNEKKGVRSWTGDLEAGNYIIECRKTNHRSTSVKKTITENMGGQTIQLQAPSPINGTLVVNSNPPMSKIVIDGKQVGETPQRINAILIGEHTLRLEKQGCAPLTKTFTIEEGKTLNLDERLDKVIVEMNEGGENSHIVKDRVNFVTFDFAYSLSPQTSFGATFGSVKKVGWFVTAASNFSFDAINFTNVANADGLVNGSYYYDYTGQSCSTRISAMAGLVVKLGGPMYMKLGAGYGSRVKSWYTTNGSLVKIADDSFNGLDATAGLLFNLKGFTMSFDAVTTNFKTVEAKVSLGFCWKKK